MRRGLPLSDHADYPDLLRFVEAVQPKRVLTLHGFAREFASTLRERGIEAWAVGKDDQLEFALGASRATTVAPSATTPIKPRADSALFPEAFARFAETADAIGRDERKSEKVATLTHYLGSLSTEAASIAALFHRSAFPQSDQRALRAGWALIERALLEVAAVSEAEYRTRRHRFADAGEAAQGLLPADAPSGRLGIAQIAASFGELPRRARRRPNWICCAMCSLSSRRARPNTGSKSPSATYGLASRKRWSKRRSRRRRRCPPMTCAVRPCWSGYHAGR
jgi:DNA ligase-1